MPEDDELARPLTYTVSRKPWGIAEGERIFLSIRPNEEGSQVRRGFDYIFVPNSANPDATVEITFHHQRRGKTTGTWDTKPYLLYNLKAGEAIRLELDSNETLALYRRLTDLYAIGAEGVPLGDRELQVHDAGAFLATGDLGAQIKTLIAKHGQQDVLAGVQALMPDPIEVVALKAEHEKRASAVVEFETHLAWDDWNELQWQAFFRGNDWIFGHGLDYQFLVTQIPQPDYGGQDLTGKGGERGDELMSTPGNIRFAVLVELKKPGTELVGSEDYRNGAWSIGNELAGGVAQIQANAESLQRKSQAGLENVRTLDARRMAVAAPRGILLIGNTKQLDNDDKKFTFHRFRRNLWNPEVITYDELLERARFLVARAAARVDASIDVASTALDSPERESISAYDPVDDGPPESDEEPPDEDEEEPPEDEEEGPSWERGLPF